MMSRAGARGDGRAALRGVALAALAFASVSGGAGTPARADLWPLPQQRTYYSENKRFAFEVTPKRLESQPAPSAGEGEKKPDAGDNYCAGVFLEARGGTYVRAAAFRLANELAPMKALVADSGRYVVTFDNWGRLGYGDEVVVIYRSDGTLVRKLGLADFLTEPDIRSLSHTASSIWWGGPLGFDEQAEHVIIRVVASRRMQPGQPAETEPKAVHHDLRIALATGELMEPKRDLFTELHWRLEPRVAPPDGNEE